MALSRLVLLLLSTFYSCHSAGAQEVSCFLSTDCRGSVEDAGSLGDASDCCAGRGLSYQTSSGVCTLCFREDDFIREGTEFAFAAVNNLDVGQFFRRANIRLSVCAVDTGPVSFSVETRDGRLTRTTPSEVSLSRNLRLTSPGDRDRGIIVRSEDGNQLSVIVISEEFTSSDSFKVLPSVNLPNTEYEYYALSVPITETVVPTATPGEPELLQEPQGNSVIVIVTSQPNTQLTLTLSQEVDISSAQDIVQQISSTVINAGETVVFTLPNAGQTLYLNSLFDVTGSRVLSNKPIAFFTGHECGTLPTEMLFCDQMVEQIPPTSTWGTTFITSPIADRIEPDMFKFLASRDNTIIRAICNDSFLIEDIELNAGEIREISSDQSCYYESTSPILVVQFSTADPNLPDGDPFMVVVPPVEQFQTQYIVNAFSAPSGPLSDAGFHYINVMVPVPFSSPEPFILTVLIDGSPVEGLVPVPCIFDTQIVCAFTAAMRVGVGLHSVETEEGGFPFGVVVYWQAFRVGQGYPGGMRQSPIALPSVSFDGESVALLAAENETALLTLVRAGDISVPADVRLRSILSTSGNPAAQVGDDYEELDLIVSFAAGETATEVELSFVNDVFPEADEEFDVYLAVSPGTFITEPSSAVVTILNDDPDLPVMNVSFAATQVEVREGDGSVSLQLLKTEGARGPVTVRVFTRDGTANFESDFLFDEFQEITFEIQDVSAPISISIRDDADRVERTEQFMVVIEAVPGPFPVNIQGGPATVTITDNDVLVVGFARGIIPVFEFPGSLALLPVSVLLGSLDEDLDIDVVFSSDTAIFGVDFTSEQPFMLTFSAVQTSTVTVPVEILDDREVEANETFFAVLEIPENETRAILFSPSSVDVIIVDEDRAIIDISVSSQLVTEGGANARVEVSVRNGIVLGENVDVVLSTFNNSALANEDFFGVRNQLITLTREVASQEFFVDIIDDGEFEGPEFESFIVAISLLSGDNNGVDIGQSMVQFFIQDNEIMPIPRIGFTDSVFNVREDGGEVTITLQSEGTNRDPVVVSYVTLVDTANVEDYTQATGTVEFVPGATEAFFTVSITNDALVEPTERFSITLGGDDSVQLALASAVVRILEDDTAVVRFQPASYSVTEGNLAVTIVVEALAEASSNISVILHTESFTALSGVDFVGIEEQLVTFEPGVLTQAVSISLSDDSQQEETELFTVHLEEAPDSLLRVLIETPTAFVLINDDDLGAVSFRIPPISNRVIEGDGSIVIPIEKLGANDAPVVVQLFTTAETAQAIEDFTPVSLSVTFAPTDTLQFVTIPINDDFSVEVEEYFSVLLSNGTLQLDNTTIFIEDNDFVSVDFDPPSYTVLEGGVVMVQLLLAGSSRIPITVSLSTVDGTATGGADYVSVSSFLLTFPPGQTSLQYPVITTADGLLEDPEEFVVALTSTQASVVQRTASIVIVDATEPLYQFEQADYTVSESEGAITVCAFEISGSTQEATIDIFPSPKNVPNAATIDVDFREEDSSPMQNGSVVCRTILIFRDDNPFEGAEQFTVTIFGQRTVGLSLVTEACVTILDSDIPPTPGAVLCFTNPGCTGTEFESSAAASCCLTGGQSYQAIDDTSPACIQCIVHGFVGNGLTAPERAQNYDIGIESFILGQPPSEPVTLRLSATLTGAGVGFAEPQDYTLSPLTGNTFDIQFDGSQTEGVSATLNLLLDSLAQEGDEEFLLELTALTPLQPNVFIRDTLLVIIQDVDETTFELGVESGQDETFPCRVILRRVGFIARPVTVQLFAITTQDALERDLFFTTPPSVVPASANDFDGVAASIIFSGSGEIEEQVVNVTVVNDDDVESTEIFVVGLEAVNTVDRLRIPAVDLCSIVNDDGVAITIQFEQPTFTVEEQQGLISIPLVANQVSIQDHIVNVMGMNGTATLAESGIEADANLGPNQSILAGLFAGQTGIELLFNVFDDDIDEPDEFFTLTLLSVDGPLGGFENFEFSDPTLITTLTVTIIDNDIPVTIQFEQPTFTVDEQSARIRIPLIASRASSLSHLVTVVGTSVTALLSADDINADAAISFEGPGQNILLGLSPGQTTLDIPVDIFEDDLVEGDEEFTLTLTPFDDSFDDFSNFDFSVPNLITTLTVTISDNDVSECTEGAVRLVGGTVVSGRVEVCVNGRFGTVCDNSEWDDNDAQVVCEQIFRPQGAVIVNGSVQSVSAGVGPINLNRVQCTGGETALLDCPSSRDTTGCTHADDAGVDCLVALP